MTTCGRAVWDFTGLTMSTDPSSDAVAHDPIQPVAFEQIAVTAEAGLAPARHGAQIGRYTHSQLAAMHGKRGRKPEEFYELFPRDPNAAAPAAPVGARKAKKTRSRSFVAVSSAVIGDHTIDELLEMIGTTGSKPVAYTILHQAAQVFADAGALQLAPVEVDPLLVSFAAAPKGIREAITALLAATATSPGAAARRKTRMNADGSAAVMTSDEPAPGSAPQVSEAIAYPAI